MKKLLCLSLALFLFLNLVSSAQIVQVDTSQPAEKPGMFSWTIAFIKSPIFWGGIVILIGIGILILILVLLISYLVKYFHERNNIFLQQRKERIKMAGVQARFPCNHWLRTSKNPDVRLVKMEKGKPIITRAIGHYRGDYVTNEGNHCIAINLLGVKKFWWFPFWKEIDMIVIPHNKELGQGKKKITNLPTSKTVIQFSENEVLLWCEGISRTGEYYIPVIKDRRGEVIDMAMPVYEALKERILGDYLYEQTDEFGKLAKKGMEINPSVRAINKTADSSQSVEIPQGNEKSREKL